jgi:aryl-alcohol dehydrogenase-like predicted oxidoreductase
MEYGHLPGIDKPISRLVQGTMPLDPGDPEESLALLDEVYELGCNTFDTAHVYGGGDRERLLGRWIKERGLREEIVVLTKGAHPNADRDRVTPFDITSDLHDSLARLNLETIDLYLLHRDDPAVEVGPIVEVLNKHQEAGLIAAFGGSNWSHERLQAANAYAETHGLTPFVASSPQFSLAEMVQPPWEGCISVGGPEGEAARAWYQETGMALFTWSSLAGGFFSGRFARDNLDSFESTSDVLCVGSYCYEWNFQRLDRTLALAQKRGLTVPQVALAYVLSHSLNVFALVGCRNRAEFEENLVALETGLSASEIAWLDLTADAL